MYTYGMKKDEVKRILEASRFMQSSFPFKYLGVLICSKKITTAECEMLIDKTTIRIRVWSTMTLSYMARA